MTKNSLLLVLILSLFFISSAFCALVKDNVTPALAEEAVNEIAEDTQNEIPEANDLEEAEDVVGVQSVGILRFEEEPSDGSECYTLSDGADYRGTKSTTLSGRTCQQWTSQYPHEHTVLPENYANSGLGDHNYCRNPDDADDPWCYTTDQAQRWEYCDVGSPKSSCSDDSSRTGFVYNRWGHSSCPGNAKLIYHGMMAGKYYSHGGGGSNYLCLPEIPTYDDDVVVHGGQGDRATLYHAQYYASTGPFASKRFHDAPCAVCLQEYRNNHFMYPGRDDCPNGWTREYYGYLMSADSDFGTTEYVCIDVNGEVLPGTSINVYGALLYPVESKCPTGGGLPCAPYVDGYELTCAICSI